MGEKILDAGGILNGIGLSWGMNEKQIKWKQKLKVREKSRKVLGIVKVSFEFQTTFCDSNLAV
jgi:hypothetical protein